MARVMLLALKINAQSELQNSRIAGRRRLAELANADGVAQSVKLGRIGQSAVGFEFGRCVHRGELRVIEHVVGFSPEL